MIPKGILNVEVKWGWGGVGGEGDKWKKKNSKNSIITAKDTISKIKKKIHPS